MTVDGRRARRGIVVVGACVAAVVGLAGCSGQVSSTDAYRAGCTAVDTIAAGGDVASSAAQGGLHQLYASRVLGDEAQAWLGDALTAIDAGNVTVLSPAAKQRLVAGCADHGYTLGNLT